jgi:hypothetical protein
MGKTDYGALLAEFEALTDDGERLRWTVNFLSHCDLDDLVANIDRRGVDPANTLSPEMIDAAMASLLRLRDSLYDPLGHQSTGCRNLRPADRTLLDDSGAGREVRTRRRSR